MGQRCEDDRGFAISGSVLIGYTGASGNVVVPEGVSEIGGKAFFDCDSLTSVVIPWGVRKIGEGAFYGCMTLREIVFGGTEEQWDAIEKDDGWNEGFVGEHERKIFFDQTSAHG